MSSVPVHASAEMNRPFIDAPDFSLSPQSHASTEDYVSPQHREDYRAALTMHSTCSDALREVPISYFPQANEMGYNSHYSSFKGNASPNGLYYDPSQMIQTPSTFRPLPTYQKLSLDCAMDMTKVPSEFKLQDCMYAVEQQSTEQRQHSTLTGTTSPDLSPSRTTYQDTRQNNHQSHLNTSQPSSVHPATEAGSYSLANLTRIVLDDNIFETAADILMLDQPLNQSVRDKQNDHITRVTPSSYQSQPYTSHESVIPDQPPTTHSYTLPSVKSFIYDPPISKYTSGGYTKYASDISKNSLFKPTFNQHQEAYSSVYSTSAYNHHENSSNPSSRKSSPSPSLIELAPLRSTETVNKTNEQTTVDLNGLGMTTHGSADITQLDNIYSNSKSKYNSCSEGPSETPSSDSLKPILTVPDRSFQTDSYFPRSNLDLQTFQRCTQTFAFA